MAHIKGFALNHVKYNVVQLGKDTNIVTREYTDREEYLSYTLDGEPVYQEFPIVGGNRPMILTDEDVKSGIFIDVMYRVGIMASMGD